MARIAFLNERLPPDDDPVSGFSYELIRSLADQQHEIRVFSTYRSGGGLPPSHPRIQILRPFHSWSWLEVPRAMPLLMEFRPEILHVVEPRAEAVQGFTNAMSALASLKSLFGNPPLVTSFYDVRGDRLKKHRALLLISDAVTVSNEPQLKLLEDFFSRFSRKPELAVLPLPAPVYQEQEDEAVSSPLLENVKEFSSDRELVFVPGDVGAHRDPAGLFQALAAVLEKHPKVAIVFGGSWSGVARRIRHQLLRTFEKTGERVLFTGPLTVFEEKGCLSLAKFVFLASLPIESLSSARLTRTALEVFTLPILNSEQARLDSLNWVHGENAWITTTDARDWSRSVSEALDSATLVERIRARLSEFARREAIDQPGNAITRLYARLLA